MRQEINQDYQYKDFNEVYEDLRPWLDDLLMYIQKVNNQEPLNSEERADIDICAIYIDSLLTHYHKQLTKE